MIALLKLLFLGHSHKWKIIDTTKLMYKDHKLPVGTRYDLQCEKCGKVKAYSTTSSWCD